MRVVADTNTVISGLLWHGPPRQVLDAARHELITLYTSPVLLGELQEVLSRSKFVKRLQSAGVTSTELILGYAALVTLLRPATIDAVIQDDPDDDHVLACALAAQAGAIVSGDQHLLSLGEYQGISVLDAPGLLARLPTSA